jgi:hypothetical protein
VKDELGGANVDCCDCPNGLGAGTLLKPPPAALLPLLPSRDFGALILRNDVSGIMRQARLHQNQRELTF